MTLLHSSDCQNERTVRAAPADVKIRTQEVFRISIDARTAVILLHNAMIDGHLERMQPIAADLSDIAMRLSDTAKVLEQQIAKHRRRNPLSKIGRV